MDESLEGNQDKEETAVKPVPVDGEIMEENLEGNQDDEKTEVTSSPVGGETVEEEFQENLEPENAGAISGPMDKERGTSEDQGEKNQDEEDRQMKMVKRSQTSSPQDWYTQEVPKRMRMQPPARSSLVEPYMAEPAGLDLSVERAGPRDTSDVVQLPPAPPHRLYNPVVQRFFLCLPVPLQLRELLWLPLHLWMKPD